MRLEAVNLSFSYHHRKIFYNANFCGKEGEFICILRANGSGKSTFLNCLCRLLKSESGKVTFNGQDIKNFSFKKLSRCISYVPQNYNPTHECTIRDFLLMGRTPYTGLFPGFHQEDVFLVDKAMRNFGLCDQAEKNIAQLGGGERKKLLLIRALVQDTPVIILDEPTKQLDFGARVQFLEMLKSLTRKGKCLIVTTHSPEDAPNYADRFLLFMNSEVSTYPTDHLTARVIDELYRIESEIVAGRQIPHKACIARRSGIQV